MKTKIQIKSIIGSLLFEYECENNTIAKTVEQAVISSANLRYANLRSADLSSADLSYADLRSADLSSADLSSADLSYADLSSADLSSANLRSADLSFTDLSYANLRSADLSSADLSSANLSFTDLSLIKNDLWDVLIRSIPEIPALKDSLIHGKVDGSCYEGECCCLIGTLEKQSRFAAVIGVDKIRNSSRPIEQFFMGIKKDDTPETNQISAIVLEWINEFESFVIPNPIQP